MNLGEISQSLSCFTQHTSLKPMLEISLSDLQSFCVIAILIVLHSVFFNINIFVLAHIGGLLTLFLGFSAVSLVEIFYFIALRSYCGRHPNQESSELQEHLPKTNCKSKVPRLTTQDQIWPCPCNSDGYANHQTVAYRRRY